MSSALFDFSHPPFDSLNAHERSLLERSLDIQYFPVDSTPIKKGEVVSALYVIIKGVVIEAGESEKGDISTIYVQHDCFDSRALISGKGSITLTTQEDTLVHCIPRDTALTLTERNPLFGAFFFQDVAKRLAVLAHRPHQQAFQSMMLAHVEQAFIRKPVWLPASATVWEAANLMREAHTSSVLIHDAENTPDAGGIFTQSDLRNFVIEGHNAKTTPVAGLAHYTLHSIEADEPIHRAILLMTRHTVQRLIVRRQTHIIGVLEQVDLLSYLNDHSHLVSAQIERACTLEDLHIAWKNTDQLINMLHNNGVKVTLIASLMGELRHQLYARIFVLLAPSEVIAHTCLLALGSEGRAEQILKTDQDNALIIEDGFTHPELENICQRFNEALIDFGYPRCAGGIMICNIAWRRTLTSFKQLINTWLDSASGENMMNLAIWIDAHPICGKEALFDALREYWERNMTNNASFFARFMFPVEQFDIPLDIFSRLVTDKNQHDQLDLKKGGIFPLVHGIRGLALQARLRQCNSYLRVEALAQLKLIPSIMAQDLSESLAFLQNLQLKYGLQKQLAGQPVDNFINPSQLTTLERDLLKDTFSVVKRFKQHLRHHYRLNAL